MSTSLDPLYQVRQYGTQMGDYQLVDAWMLAHGRPPFRENLMPALGLFACHVEPDGTLQERAAAWLYLDNSIGVCHLDHAVTRSGLTLHQSFEALQVVIEALAAEARAMDYGHMNLFAPPAIARHARRAGFHPEVEGLVMLTRRLVK